MTIYLHSTRALSPGDPVPWLLVGATGLWAADCLAPGCLWTVTTSTPEAADDAAYEHTAVDHADTPYPTYDRGGDAL